MAFKATGALVREFVLDELSGPDPTAIAQKISAKFGITRQAAHRHLQRIATAGLIESTGSTRNKEYRLASLTYEGFRLQLATKIEEDVVWRERIAPQLVSM